MNTNLRPQLVVEANIIDAAFDLTAFCKRTPFPKENTAPFFELTRLVGCLDTSCRAYKNYLTSQPKAEGGTSCQPTAPTQPPPEDDPGIDVVDPQGGVQTISARHPSLTELAAKDAEIATAHAHMDKLREHRNELDAACHELEAEIARLNNEVDVAGDAAIKVNHLLGEKEALLHAAQSALRESEAAREEAEQTHHVLLPSERVQRLAQEFEQWPASEQQTKCSLLLVALVKELDVYERTRPLTDHEKELIDQGWKKIKAAEDAARAQEAKP